MSEKFGPCLDKNCSWCCNPVKISYRKGFPEPKPDIRDRKEKELFIKSDETLIPKKEIDTTRIATYECLNFDEKTGKCIDYENHPDICRNTSCINSESNKTINEQHNQAITTEFIKIKK